MRGLLWLFALFALAASVSLAARYNDGYMLLVFPPYRAEITLNLAIAILLIGFVLLYAFLRAVVLTLGLPGRVRKFRMRSQREKAFVGFQEAMRLLFEGRFGQALKKAAQAHAAGQSPGLAALIAARAAQRLREPAKQQAWLEQAALDCPQMQAARLMLEAEMHIDAHKYEEGVAALQQLQKLSGRHIAALRLELRAQQGCGNWNEVLRLVRLLEKRDAMLPEATREIRLKAHRENIRLRRDDVDSLLCYLRELPAGELNPRLTRAFAEALLPLGAADEVQRMIEVQLEAEWDSSLLPLYARSAGREPGARLARAEHWLATHSRDAQLLHALGRLCFMQRLWGKAQSYLEAALSLQPLRETHLELARLLEQTGRAEDAMRHYRAAAEWGT